MSGWIGVDLDGTLAHYDEWRGMQHIGDPIPVMVERVREWIIAGCEVKIVTARAADPVGESVVRDWCFEHVGQALEVTDRKDWNMIELWDDRCVQVEKNTGRRMDGEL